MRLQVYQVAFERDGTAWIAHKGRHRVRIEPDGRYPDMWRLQYPSGGLSDMINLARARDAALGIVESLEFVGA